jgi:DNA uptake protein ComE-like DNA-binding protein
MFRRLLREYFSLTRGERRGIQILSLLVLVFIAIRISLPGLMHPGEPELSQLSEDFTAFKDSLEKLDAAWAASSGSPAGRGNDGERDGYRRYPADITGSHDHKQQARELFPFDPNRAGFDDLIRLGMSGRTARTLLNYRNAGGRFDSDSDLLKIYGLHPEEFERLQPYIRIVIPASVHDDSARANVAFYDKPSYLSLTNMAHPFDLNSADSQSLLSVYGIGPVFASRIIRYRELLGGFCRPEQLLEVYGLNMQQYEELLSCSFLDTSRLRKIDLNMLNAGDTYVHPYLDRYQTASLAAYLEQMGAFEKPEEILENRLLPDSVYRRIRPYLETNR